MLLRYKKIFKKSAGLEYKGRQMLEGRVTEGCKLQALTDTVLSARFVSV